MATIYISEFLNLTFLPNAGGQIVPMPPDAEQTVGIGGGHAESQPFGSGAKASLLSPSATMVIRVNCDAVCSIAIGSSPTATTTTMRLSANQTEYFGVHPGDKLSVISNV